MSKRPLIYQSEIGHIRIRGGPVSRNVIRDMIAASGLRFHRIDDSDMIGYEGEQRTVPPLCKPAPAPTGEPTTNISDMAREPAPPQPAEQPAPTVSTRTIQGDGPHYNLTTEHPTADEMRAAVDEWLTAAWRGDDVPALYAALRAALDAQADPLGVGTAQYLAGAAAQRDAALRAVYSKVVQHG